MRVRNINEVSTANLQKLMYEIGRQPSEQDLTDMFRQAFIERVDTETRSRMISEVDLLKEFSDKSKDMLWHSALFNTVFQSLMQGASRYKIIEDLVDIIEKQQEAIEKLICEKKL